MYATADQSGDKYMHECSTHYDKIPEKKYDKSTI